MKSQGRIVLLVALVGCLAVPAGLAQSSQPAQNQQQDQQNAQNQNQNQNQDQTSGVSHPPPDSTIEADEDTTSTPNPAPPPKPSAAIPMNSAAPAQSASVAPATTPEPAVAATPVNSLDNTDYGIVTVVPSHSASSAGDASLQTRGWNPDDDIVNYVPSGPNELASGTNFTIRLSEDLSTDDAHRGESFSGVVAHNVYKDGRIIIPAGSGIRGRIVDVSQGHRVGAQAVLRLRPEAIILPDGTMYHIAAEAVQSMAPGTRIDDEGGIEAAHHYAKDAVEYGAGTGVGAVAGAEIAGPVGAGVG
ncbi:MAG: hypothetical protein WBD93_00180, partial [Acidobacteriaceae bacterium]